VLSSTDLSFRKNQIDRVSSENLD